MFASASKGRVLGTLAVSAAVCLTVLGMAGVATAQPAEDPPGLERAQQVLRDNLDQLLERRHVLGAGVGLGEQSVAIRVYLEREAGPGLPDQLDGVRVHPVVTGPIEPLRDNRPSHHRPGHGGGPPGGDNGDDDNGDDDDPDADPCEGSLDEPVDVPLGSATRHEDANSVGTIGARVKRGGEYYALSNHHVFRPDGNEDEGDRILSTTEYKSILDGLTLSDVSHNVGRLCAWVRIQSGRRGGNEVDAAIARTTIDHLSNSTPDYTPSGSLVLKTELEEELDTGRTFPVKKYGARTALTEGEVVAIDVTIFIAGFGQFTNQIEIEGDPFGGPGDSGSLVVSQDDRPTGLLFAGNRDGTTIFANLIERVMDELSLDGIE